MESIGYALGMEHWAQRTECLERLIQCVDRVLCERSRELSDQSVRDAEKTVSSDGWRESTGNREKDALNSAHGSRLRAHSMEWRVQMDWGIKGSIQGVEGGV